ncbi:response regulator transcription factor [Streptomyces mirabilis]
MADFRAFPWAAQFDAKELAAFLEDLWGAASGDDGLTTLQAVENVIAAHRPDTAAVPQLTESVVQAIAQKVTAELLPYAAGQGAVAIPCPLSRRELQCLIEIAKGESYESAGAALGVQRQTVATHAQRAYKRLQVTGAARAVAIAVHHGWISQADLALPERLEPNVRLSPNAWMEIYRERSAELRSNANEWQQVASYSTHANARRVAINIREGKFNDFRPAGAFEAELCEVDHGLWPVRARFVGGETTSSTPETDGDV